jgi:dihydroorotate dehydrogenase
MQNNFTGNNNLSAINEIDDIVRSVMRSKGTFVLSKMSHYIFDEKIQDIISVLKKYNTSIISLLSYVRKSPEKIIFTK